MYSTALFIGLLAALALLSGCEAKVEQGAAPPLVRYTVAEPERVTLTTELPGRVSAYMTSEVRPQVSGIILQRLFEEGADVKAGQVLYQIDPALFEAAWNSAKANLAKAEANELSSRLLAERYALLIKSQAVSRQEYDDALSAHLQAQAEVEAARQSLESARINLGYTRISAPVSGRISRSFVTPGALVTQNQTSALAVIQHLDTVYVDLTQSSTELIRLKRALEQGQLLPGGPESARVRLKLEDGSPYAVHACDGTACEVEWLEGELLFSDVTIDKSTGAVGLRASFANPQGMLLPGMYVRAIIEEGGLENAILLPQKSVQRDARGNPYVFVLREGQGPASGGETFAVETRLVELGRNIGNRWLITSGLQGGERVLYEGHLKARQGGVVLGEAISMDETLYSAGRKTRNTQVR